MFPIQSLNFGASLTVLDSHVSGDDHGQENRGSQVGPHDVLPAVDLRRLTMMFPLFCQLPASLASRRRLRAPFWRWPSSLLLSSPRLPSPSPLAGSWLSWLPSSLRRRRTRRLRVFPRPHHPPPSASPVFSRFNPIFCARNRVIFSMRCTHVAALVWRRERRTRYLTSI